MTATDDGIRVTDVWEKREQFEKFAGEEIGPGAAEFGLEPPQMTFFDVHNYLMPG